VEAAHQSADNGRTDTVRGGKHTANSAPKKHHCGGGRPAWVEEHLKSDDARARVNAFKAKIEIR
jgi:hypothetical protein